MPSYVPGYFPFPFPKDLECGQPYINWPVGKDIIGTSISVDVAIPEVGVEVGVGDDGNVNRTMDTYSLVLPRTRTVRCDKTKFVPMYSKRIFHLRRRHCTSRKECRAKSHKGNRIFETSDDKFVTPGAAYLEYLGTPAAHVKDHTCTTTYHLLSHQISLSTLAGYHLLSNEGNDWLFHLYSGDTGDRPYDMPSRPPLATSPVVNVCDSPGRHSKYTPGKGFACDYPEYKGPLSNCQIPSPRPTSAPVETQPPESEGHGAILGVMIGVPIGFLILVGIVLLVVKHMPQIRRRLRGDGSIQL